MNTIFILITLCSLMSSGAGSVLDAASLTQERLWSGMKDTVALRFSPNSAHVFTMEKSGRIRVYNSIDAKQDDFNIAYDISQQTFSWWDRGMLGLAVHPQFPVQPYLFILYSTNSVDATATSGPLWPRTECPVKRAPPDSREVCASLGRLDRLRFDVNTNRASLDQVLLADWCSYSGSHHVNHLEWARDGSLYLSSGDGALFNGVDHGFKNDGCFRADAQSVQGAFRAQWDNFLHGKILNINANAVLARRRLQQRRDFRVVAKGFRNPYRFTVHPFSGDLWITDVGSEFFEEINVVRDPLSHSSAVPNFGWPCVEGVQPSPSEPAAANSVAAAYCASKLLRSDEFKRPFFHYSRHQALPLPPAEQALCSGASVSANGALFYTGKNLPNKYRNSLFFLDSAKRCVFYFDHDAKGVPDASSLHVFAFSPRERNQEAGQYVDIVEGPRDGYLYLVDFASGAVDRFRALPALPTLPTLPAVAVVPPLRARLSYAVQPGTRHVTFDASRSTPLNDVKFSFDFNGDGVVDVWSTSPIVTHVYPHTGLYKARLTIVSRADVRDDADVIVNVGVENELMLVMKPPDQQWSYGDTLKVAAFVKGPSQASFQVTDTKWDVFLNECAESYCGTNTSSLSDCSGHRMELANNGVSSIELHPPQLTMPSFISVSVSVLSNGVRLHKTIETKPAVWYVSIDSFPSGLEVASCVSTPCTLQVMRNARLQLQTQQVQHLRGEFYRFVGWREYDGDSTLEISPTRDEIVHAEFERVVSRPAPPDALPLPLALTVRAESGALFARWQIRELEHHDPVLYVLLEARRSDGTLFNRLLTGGTVEARLDVPWDASMYVVRVRAIGRKGQGPFSQRVNVRSRSADASNLPSCEARHRANVIRNRVDEE